MVHISKACFEYILESTGFGRTFSFLPLQEMNTSTKGKEYRAVLLQSANKGWMITRVSVQKDKKSYSSTHIMQYSKTVE